MKLKSIFSKLPTTKTVKSTATALGLTALIVVSTSNPAMAMRTSAPCTLGDDCAATIYYRICNNWCFWY